MRPLPSRTCVLVCDGHRDLPALGASLMACHIRLAARRAEFDWEPTGPTCNSLREPELRQENSAYALVGFSPSRQIHVGLALQVSAAFPTNARVRRHMSDACLRSHERSCGTPRRSPAASYCRARRASFARGSCCVHAPDARVMHVATRQVPASSVTVPGTPARC